MFGLEYELWICGRHHRNIPNHWTNFTVFDDFLDVRKSLLEMRVLSAYTRKQITHGYGLSTFDLCH